MSTAAEPIPQIALPPKYENAAEWWHELGKVPLERIIMNPWPGTATESDLLDNLDHQDRLVELIDGTLVARAVGFYQSVVAARLITALGNFVFPRRLGVISGAGGPIRMACGRVRLPDVCFVSKADLPQGKVAHEAIATLAPTVVAEVLRDLNTPAEMRQKMKEYFESAARLVWLVDPQLRRVDVYETLHDEPTRTLSESDTLDGGDVLHGFHLCVADLFSQLLG